MSFKDFEMDKKMDALVKHHDPLMGYYFSCPHCQQKYVSAECVQEHSPNCHMQPSLLIPQIESHSSLNPQAVGLNFDSQGFQIRHEAIQKEPEAHYTEDDHIDWQDETEESTLTSPAEIYQKYVPNRLRLQLNEAGPRAKILGDSVQSPNSTCKEDGYLWSHCPRKFPQPSVAHQNEDCREPKFLCDTCGKCFALKASFKHHKRSHHQPALMSDSVKAFKSSGAQLYHHETQSRGGWNEFQWRPRILQKNHQAAHRLFLDNGEIGHEPMAHKNSLPESSLTDLNDKTSNNIPATSSTEHMKSHDPPQRVSCYYPGCTKTFSSKFTRWSHLKTHPGRLWNTSEEISGMVGSNQTSEDAPLTTMPVIDNKGTKNQPVGQQIMGRKLVGLKITGRRKVIAKETIQNAMTARQPSQSSQKIQLDKNSKSDHSIPGRSETGGLSPGESVLFTCGICEGSFEQYETLILHMLTTHARPEEPQAEEMEEIGTLVDKSFGGVRLSCKGNQIPVALKANQSTSTVQEKNLNARAIRSIPALRHPIVKIGDKKYYYCGIPGCDAVFNNRHARYKHHKKSHKDAYRSMLTEFADRQLSQQKFNAVQPSNSFMQFDFDADNFFQTDSGLGSELNTEASGSNPAQNIVPDEQEMSDLENNGAILSF